MRLTQEQYVADLPHLIPKGTEEKTCARCKAKVFEVSTTRSGDVVFDADGFPHRCQQGELFL